MATNIGTIIDDKYEVLTQIGKGGMSVVYLAMDKRLNKQWAVKEIRKTSSGKKNEVIVNSLVAEANLMKKLDHPALPRIVDIIDNGETIYVVMDYIEGESLDKILKEYGPQPQDVVIEWAKQLCDALGYLHSQKPPIIYRDMKPANIMLKPEGNLKVIDFGIAREYKETNLSDTTVMGTNGYAPPEQHGSRQTDARSDIYALGMTIHHLLTGADPRPADYMYAPIRQWNPHLSSGLERVVDKCTALDPADRYQSCNELMYALEHYEEEDTAYKRKQKKKLRTFIMSAAMTVIMLGAGIGGQVLKADENNKDYDNKINIDDSTPYETKVETYLEAIDIYGNDTRAYMKLLEAYKQEGAFGEAESNRFTNKYNENRDSFDTNTEEYLALMYEAGRMYFTSYDGGDNTFRTRVLKSYSYFTAIHNINESAEHVEYSNYGISESYYTLGKFYTDYVVNGTGISEPVKEDYDSLIESLNACIDNADDYAESDGSNTRLTMYKEIANLINDHRTGLASTMVEQEGVISLLRKLKEKAESQSVSIQVNIDLRNELIGNDNSKGLLDEYIENIDRAYQNTANVNEANSQTANAEENTGN